MTIINKEFEQSYKNKCLKSFDIYGKKVDLSLNGTHYLINTNFGGIISLLFITLSFSYVFQQFEIMIVMGGSAQFTVSDQIININAKNKNENEKSDTDFGELIMSDYQDTFNFIVGTTNETIDLLDNPYVSFQIYDLNETFIPHVSP